MLDLKKCSDISKVPLGPFMNGIKKQNFFHSDLNNQVELLYDFSRNEMYGLIGADVAEL